MQKRLVAVCFVFFPTTLFQCVAGIILVHGGFRPPLMLALLFISILLCLCFALLGMVLLGAKLRAQQRERHTHEIMEEFDQAVEEEEQQQETEIQKKNDILGSTSEEDL